MNVIESCMLTSVCIIFLVFPMCLFCFSEYVYVCGCMTVCVCVTCKYMYMLMNPQYTAHSVLNPYSIPPCCIHSTQNLCYGDYFEMYPSSNVSR